MNGGHERCFPLPFPWPTSPFEIALVEPRIPPNTGNIARSCAATGSKLHLVEPLGFNIDDATVRRAGLDYWESVDLTVHPDTPSFLEATAHRRRWWFSTGGEKNLYDVSFEPGDLLVFGDEVRGLDDAILEDHRDEIVQIPILTDHVRSLNLSNSVAICLYEALRQSAQGA